MFNFDLHHHGAGVFWAIGWSMVLLSVLIHLPTSVVTIFGVAMISLHNLLDGLTAQEVGLPGWLWTILHSPGDAVFLEGSFSVSAVGSALGLAGSPAGQGPFLGLASLANGRVGDFTFGTGYCLLPWMGTMAAGYGFGKLLLLERSRRRTYLFLLGTALTLAFVSLRTINGYGDPKPRLDYADPGLTICSFLNCTKYPASLLYLLMTLGPSILALAAFDRPLPPLVRPVITFGRVPLFYYLLHVPLIHGGAVLLDYFRFGWSPLATSGPWLPREEYPPGYGISLPVVYIIWVGVVLLLYPACKWFAGVKQRRREAWLSYF